MTTMNVLGARVVLGIVCQVDSGFIVEVQPCRFLVWLAEFAQESAQVSGFFGCFRCCDDLGLAGCKGRRRLFLAAPGDGSFAVHEYMSGSGVTRRPVGVGESCQGKR
eukprot:1820328-Pleurochrysis_carterae.AAC.1